MVSQQYLAHSPTSSHTRATVSSGVALVVMLLVGVMACYFFRLTAAGSTSMCTNAAPPHSVVRICFSLDVTSDSSDIASAGVLPGAGASASPSDVAPASPAPPLVVVAVAAVVAAAAAPAEGSLCAISCVPLGSKWRALTTLSPSNSGS